MNRSLPNMPKFSIKQMEALYDSVMSSANYKNAKYSDDFFEELVDEIVMMYVYNGAFDWVNIEIQSRDIVVKIDSYLDIEVFSGTRKIFSSSLPAKL